MNELLFNKAINGVKSNSKILKYEQNYSHFTNEQIKILFEMGTKVDPKIIKYVPSRIKYNDDYNLNEWFLNLLFDVIKRNINIVFSKKLRSTLNCPGTNNIQIYCAQILGKKFIQNVLEYNSYTFYIKLKIFKHQLEIIEICISNGNLSMIEYINPPYVRDTTPTDLHPWFCKVKNDTPDDLEAYNLTQNLYKKVISQNGMMIKYIRYVQYTTLELFEIAIKNNPSAIMFVPNGIPYINDEITVENIKNLCEKAVFFAGLNRYILPDMLYIVTKHKIYDQNEILSHEYLQTLLTNIRTQLILPQLNLLEIAAIKSTGLNAPVHNGALCALESNEFTDLIFDVYELISEYI